MLFIKRYNLVFIMLQLCTLLESVCPYTQVCGFLSSIMAQPLPLTTSSKMQAWQIHSYGGLKELHLESVTTPSISNTNQLLIKVRATGLNPIDLIMLDGYGKSLLSVLRWYKNALPLIVGREFAGTVIEKGRCVSDDQFKIGDEVYGIIPLEKQGCQAEYVVADKAQILLRPPHLSVNEAASVLYTSITAWSALFLSGGLAACDPARTKVLVIGASGGVGTVATQILKSQNATVVAICSTDAIPLVTSLGADYVYDYRDAEHVAKVASHGIYDIILDCAKYGYQKVPTEWQYKIFVTLDPPLANNTDRYGLIPGMIVSASNLLSSNIPRIFSGQSVRWGFFSPQPSAFTFLDKLIKSKELKPIVQKVYKFNEVSAAYEKLAAGHLRGKLVIEVQESNN